MTIPFLSRHIPTAAQAATVRARFGEMTCPVSPVLEPGRVNDQVCAAVLPEHREMFGYTDQPRVVAGVFPIWAALELMRQGWHIVEFVNEPSARERGAFVCRGAFIHSVNEGSEWLPCPISADDQERPLRGLYA